MKLNIKVEGQAFAVEVGDLNQRPVQVIVDGETFEVWPEEPSPLVSFSPAAAARSTASVPASSPLPTSGAVKSVVQESVKSMSVVAPIPGVIVSINVKQGDRVVIGQELCVLEAMKMKNLIRSNRAGVIASIKVSPGDQVKHNQVLIELDD